MFEENEISINANGGTELAKRQLGNILDKDLLDNFQIICSRIRKLEKDKIRIYWVHDLPGDPECNKLADKSFRDKFHKIVYVSNHQYSQFRTQLNIPFDKEKDIVIENGITPFQFETKFDDGKIHLIYASTPQRGLNILIPVFKVIKNIFPDVHLHVFSSFKIYGWEQMDEQFNVLFEQCKNDPDITYYGFQPYDKVREVMSKCHILAYPNIWEETSCRVLIEAMSAGLMCVHPNLGALPETSGGLTNMYQYDQDLQRHAQIFADNLAGVIHDVEFNRHNYIIGLQKQFIDYKHDIDHISKKWEFMLNSLLKQYPNEKSRIIPAEVIKF